MGDHTIIPFFKYYVPLYSEHAESGKVMRESDIAYSSGLKSQYTTAITLSYTPVVSRKLTSFDSLLSANVKERTCVLCGAFWAQLRNVPPRSQST